MAYFVLIDILLLWIKEGVYQINSLVYTWRDRIESSGNTQSSRFKNNTSRRGAAFLTIHLKHSIQTSTTLNTEVFLGFHYLNANRMGNHAVTRSTLLIHTLWKQCVVFKTVELWSCVESLPGSISCWCQCCYLKQVLIGSLSSWTEAILPLCVLQKWTYNTIHISRVKYWLHRNCCFVGTHLGMKYMFERDYKINWIV